MLQEGSVDEESTKSDEEYDDLAMQDMQENGEWLDDVKLGLDHQGQSVGMLGDRYRQNLDLFLRSRTRNEPMSEPPCSYAGNFKMRKRSLSIPALGKHGSLINGPILSGASQG